MVDVRLNNSSQLAGFSKGADLKYFLSAICACDYAHLDEFAPTKEPMEGYKGKKIPWEEYAEGYSSLGRNRGCLDELVALCRRHENVCLLCSEAEAVNCHRRLLAASVTVEHL